jgi:phosphoadenosine phosphosulfate reductase
LSTSLSYTPRDYVPDLSRWLESRSPAEVLAFVADLYTPRIAFATGFGPEGCVLLDLIGRERLPIRVFTLDTGLLFPETYDLWRRLEEHTGVRIEAVRPALTDDAQARPLLRAPEDGAATCGARGPGRLGERDPA